MDPEFRHYDPHMSTSSIEMTEVESIASSEELPYPSTKESNFVKSESGIRSLRYPLSWPSGGNLANLSDVYPDEHTTIEQDDSRRTLYPSDQEFLRDVSVDDEVDNSPSSSSRYSAGEDIAEYEVEGISGDWSLTNVTSLQEILEPDFDIVEIEKFLMLPIPRAVLSKVCFGEHLMISLHYKYCNAVAADDASDDLNIQNAGKMTIDVQHTENKIIIYTSSEFTFEGKTAKSTIVSTIDPSFQLIEERRTESLLRSDGKKTEKSLHIVGGNRNYLILRKSSEQNTVKTTKDKISFHNEGTLIMDGGCFVFMRYLVKSKFFGELATWTMHISGEICRSVFIVSERKKFRVNNVDVLAVCIMRLIYRKSSNHPKVSKTYILPTGHILRHRWSNCNYLIHMDPLTCKIPPCRFLEHLAKNWKKDEMLQAKYLDMKEAQKSEIKSYLADNGMIKDLLKDYLLFLLERKPEDILDFTIDYFQKLYFGTEDKED